jgi:hypothetical protein
MKTKKFSKVNKLNKKKHKGGSYYSMPAFSRLTPSQLREMLTGESIEIVNSSEYITQFEPLIKNLKVIENKGLSKDKPEEGKEEILKLAKTIDQKIEKTIDKHKFFNIKTLSKEIQTEQISLLEKYKFTGIEKDFFKTDNLLKIFIGNDNKIIETNLTVLKWLNNLNDLQYEKTTFISLSIFYADNTFLSDLTNFSVKEIVVNFINALKDKEYSKCTGLGSYLCPDSSDAIDILNKLKSEIINNSNLIPCGSPYKMNNNISQDFIFSGKKILSKNNAKLELVNNDSVKSSTRTASTLGRKSRTGKKGKNSKKGKKK